MAKVGNEFKCRRRKGGHENTTSYSNSTLEVIEYRGSKAPGFVVKPLRKRTVRRCDYCDSIYRADSRDGCRNCGAPEPEENAE